MKNTFAFYQGAQPGINGLSQRLMGAAGMRQSAADAELKNLASVDQSMAVAEYNRAKAAGHEATNAALADDEGAIAGLAAVSRPIVQRFLQHQRTGGQIPLPVPNDDEGNAMPAAFADMPADVKANQSQLSRALQTLAARRLSTGANPDQIAQAQGHFQGQGITDEIQRRIAAGADMTQTSAMNQGAKPGTKIVLADDIGATGAVLNPATGKVSTDNPLAAAELARRDADVKLKGDQGAAALALARKRDAPPAAKGGPGKTGKAPSGYMWGEPDEEGRPTMVPIPGGPADKPKGRPLPGKALGDLAAAGTAVEDTARLAGSFKPGYGGNTLLGDLSNTWKRIAGDETGQAQWWQDMDMLQNQIRHTLFGSALTATELKAWEKTSITPRMDAKQIQDNLSRRQEIEARAASKLARSYAAGGYNETQIREALGIAADYLDAAAPPVASVKGGASGTWDGNDRRGKPTASGLSAQEQQELNALRARFGKKP